MPKVSKNQLDLAVMIGANIHLVSEDVAAYFTKNDNRSQISGALLRGFVLPGTETGKSETVTEVASKPGQATASIVLNSTGPIFADWLEAREKLHEFLTGEKVKLCEMFVIPDALLLRNDIMPVFRPAGASNRDAVNWKKKLGIVVWEEIDVMKYENAKGPKAPELCYISRSARPDENTLGEKAESPDGLVKVAMEKNQAWLNLYGWSDADNLHLLINEEHLDPKETVTWFPKDRLPDGRVACGGWGAGGSEVGFDWHRAGHCAPSVGARLATFLPLKTP